MVEQQSSIHEKEDRLHEARRESSQIQLKVASSAGRPKGLFKSIKRKYLSRVGDMFQVSFGDKG